MARYPLNLPQKLKQDAEHWAKQQGVSLNQFVLWAVAEKVGVLKQDLDDPNFPQIFYRRGASGHPTPFIRGTGIRVQTIVIAHQKWQMSPERIAEEYELSCDQVEKVLAFYNAHQQEIDLGIDFEQTLAEKSG